MSGEAEPDTQVFEEVHRRFLSRVYAFHFRFVGDKDTAEDLSVETFLSLYRRREDFHGTERQIRHRVLKEAIHTCRRHLSQIENRKLE